MTYVDSSALVPLYVPERFSAASRTAVREAGQVPFTALHQLEVRNAFEVLAGRRLITASEHDAVLAHLEDDLAHHRLLPVDLDLERVYAGACALSRRYSAKFLSRSLDLLHVASAQLSGSSTFVSADDRQLGVAKATGLAVVDIKHHSRRRRRT